MMYIYYKFIIVTSETEYKRKKQMIKYETVSDSSRLN